MEQTLTQTTRPSDVHAMEHISEIITRTTVGKTIIGRELNCKFCSSDARVILEDRRYMVRCPTCQQAYYLKEQWL